MDETKEYLNEIDKSLEKLKTDFNAQLTAISDDKHSFHNNMIDLTAKYPEHKELIQFTVLVNDKLETKQENYSELVSSSFNELILVKKNLIKAIQAKKTNDLNKKGIWKGLLEGSKMFGDLKIILMSIAAILFTILIYIKPEILVGVLKALATLVL